MHESVGPEGPQGEAGAIGPQGPIGPAGPQGPPASGAVIPFSVGSTTAPLSTYATGSSDSVLIASFGSHSASGYQLMNGQFILPPGDGNQHAFVIPYTATVKTISAVFTNATAFDVPAGAEVYPYVVLAIAAAAGNIFTILRETETAASTPWVGGAVPEGAMLSGFTADMRIEIPRNSRVAICCAFRTAGIPAIQTCRIYYSGGILLA